MAAGTETIPPLPIAGARKGITEVIAACTEIGNALNDCPLKTTLLNAATGMNQTLAGLPKDDAPVETIKPEPIISGLLSTITATTAFMGQLKAGMMDDLQAGIQRHIADKIAKGELHTTEDMNSKCDAARHETHASMMAHMKNFRARMQTMAAAKVPEPAEAVMLLEDKDFTPKFETAKNRCAALEPYGVGPDRLQVLAWSTDDSSFTAVVETLKAAVKPPEKKEDKKNPFENSNPGGGDGRTRFIGAGL